MVFSYCIVLFVFPSLLFSVTCQRLLYAVGGFDGERRLSTVERYDPETDSWEELASLNRARSGAGKCIDLDWNCLRINFIVTEGRSVSLISAGCVPNPSFRLGCKGKNQTTNDLFVPGRFSSVCNCCLLLHALIRMSIVNHSSCNCLQFFLTGYWFRSASKWLFSFEFC